MLRRRLTSLTVTVIGAVLAVSVLDGCYDDTNLLGTVTIGGQPFINAFGGASAGGAGGNHFTIDAQCATDGEPLTLSKDCALDADCAEVRATDDVRIGKAAPNEIAVVAINAAEVARFQQFAALCPKKVGSSGPPPIQTEDGKTAPADSEVTIACVTGRCQTSLP
jgi:hypothetical protein